MTPPINGPMVGMSQNISWKPTSNDCIRLTNIRGPRSRAGFIAPLNYDSLSNSDVQAYPDIDPYERPIIHAQRPIIKGARFPADPFFSSVTAKITTIRIQVPIIWSTKEIIWNWISILKCLKVLTQDGAEGLGLVANNEMRFCWTRDPQTAWMSGLEDCPGPWITQSELCISPMIPNWNDFVRL